MKHRNTKFEFRFILKIITVHANMYTVICICTYVLLLGRSVCIVGRFNTCGTYLERAPIVMFFEFNIFIEIFKRVSNVVSCRKTLLLVREYDRLRKRNVTWRGRIHISEL